MNEKVESKKALYTLFELFLKKHRAHKRFCSEFYMNRPTESRASYYNNTMSSSWIWFAFSWRYSEQGYDYWERVSDMWKSWLKAHKF